MGDTQFSKKSAMLTIGFFFLLAALVYGMSLCNDFVGWDDGLLITENPLVAELSFASIKKDFTTFDPELYIPFTFLSYQLNYAIAGYDPFIYHVTNLLLHTI